MAQCVMITLVRRAGLRFMWIRAHMRGAPTPEEARGRITSFHDVMFRQEALAAPTVAAARSPRQDFWMSINAPDFQRDLIALIPQLRAFARSLCGDATLADDLAQEALLRAWRRQETYSTGTNLRAWMFMILRNTFYSHRRKAWRSASLDPELAERLLVTDGGQEGRLDLQDLRRALDVLPDHQREALILVGASGMTYQEAAALTGVTIGTVKSRVCRARLSLQQVLAWDRPAQDDPAPANRALRLIMGQLDQVIAA